jgi:hypothetical protein
MALNATAVSVEGRATMIGLPRKSWAETAEPTLMLASDASALLELPGSELAESEPPDPRVLESVPDPLPPELPQAASSMAHPTPVPASSTRRSTPRG